jgi:RNA polymerase sigma factor (sigma-70 family)
MNGNRTTSIALSHVSKEKTDTTSDAREVTASLFEQFGDKVYTAMRLAGCSTSDAEDITQTTFLRLYDALDNGTLIATPDAWIFSASYRLLIDRVRAQHYDTGKAAAFKRRMLTRRVPTPEELLLEQQRAAALRKALAARTPLEKRCLLERARGRTLETIGKNVGLDMRRVGEVIKGAVEKLREAVDE